MSEPVSIARALSRAASALRFAAPVAYVYNPLDYAWDPHRSYLERWGAGRPEVLLLGMNPGPFGMAQTGVPFGEVSLVRDWLGVTGKVGKPGREHPKRPISGFDCARSEVSGARLWGWAKARFVTPEKFFKKFLVLNYCPLVFMEEGGKNLTPDGLPAAERAPLEAACDEALRRFAAHYKPRLVVGVGQFAERRARVALSEAGCGFGNILHPSPASPKANKGWAEEVERQFKALDVAIPA
ncbi:MAG: single-stranded DNA-binding protein [Elusimicrobia bacterium]|nr:single-stranded DNA-binding protein [Elusimicrobiota bacterium]